ncbi:MAG: endonuclease [Candidatus Cloacimonetes bacterium]|nr:endonuclease [Candidatus Cloacimonadota bacterium]
MKKTILILVIIIFVSCNLLFTQEDYYKKAKGLSGEQLKSALHNIIKDHKKYPYFSDTVGVGEMMMVLDEDPDNQENIILFYTNRSQPKKYTDWGDDFNYMQEYSIPHEDAWNREHTWPKSHGFPDRIADTAYTDIHHLRPSDRSVNGAKGAKGFDYGGYWVEETDSVFTDFDSWEPFDDIKGDVARMLFYMVVRYENDGEYDLEIVDSTGTSGPYIGKLSTLLQWHKMDAVDEREKRRNDLIYERFQHNRNPFVDHPEFVTEIWGEPEYNPIINLSAPEVRFGNVKIATACEPVKYAATAYNLESELKISAPVGFQISKQKTGKYTNTLILYPQDNYVNRIIYVRFRPENSRVYNDYLKLSAAGAVSKKLPLAGRGVDPATKIILQESFEQGEGEWKEYSIASNRDWYHSSYSGRWFMKISGYNGNEPSNDWLISPCIDLTTYESATLHLETAKNYDDTINGLQIKISTDYPGEGNPQNFGWKSLDLELSKGDYKWAHSGYINLQEFAGEKVYLAFHYRNTSPRSATTWEVDDIVVTGVPAKP